MRQLGRVDGGTYGRAFLLLARNPTLMLGPFLAAIASAVLLLVFSVPQFGGNGVLGAINGGIVGLIVQILDGFGLGLALIGADTALRRGRAAFDDMWDQARRRAGDLFIAALGFNFVIWIAQLVGGFIPFGSLALSLIALFFFIYTLPAAAIGGIPGGAALQVSLERAQRNLLPTALVTVVYVVAYFLLPSYGVNLAASVLQIAPMLPIDPVVVLSSAVIKAIGAGYLAIVLAKAYNDASYGRRY